MLDRSSRMVLSGLLPHAALGVALRTPECRRGGTTRASFVGPAGRGGGGGPRQRHELRPLAGAEITMRSADPAVIAAVHAWLAAQKQRPRDTRDGYGPLSSPTPGDHRARSLWESTSFSARPDRPGAVAGVARGLGSPLGTAPRPDRGHDRCAHQRTRPDRSPLAGHGQQDQVAGVEEGGRKGC